MRKSAIPFCILFTFLLGVRHGQLALISEETGAVCRTYPLPVAMLPLADQHNLASGIEIRDSRHLAQILEDYLS